ncbi:MAG: hypothetical protein JNK85_24000 [Verrucomicrobiales bacterium]|nr:hypothetical protein [Verrucomicrobiales bacterium]
MNPSPVLQSIGNLCLGVATLIYVVPLQYLLLELSRKRDDGGGTLAGILLLLPMWLLLLVASLCVAAAGGFDGLRLGRSTLYTLVVLAVLAMTLLSFMRFEFPRHPNFATRFVGGLPIYLLPAATIQLVLLSLNPGLLPGIPRPWVGVPWLVCAALSLALCGGFLGYRLAAAGKARVMGLVSRLGHHGVTGREILAGIPQLDPDRDFAELLKRTNEFESRAVRAAALERLRAHPEFLNRLIAELGTRSPEHALAAVEFATLTPEEKRLLAPPARSAIERVTNEIQREFRYFPKDRRKSLQRWGTRLFASIAAKFQGSGVDFLPAIEGFTSTFSHREKDYH